MVETGNIVQGSPHKLHRLVTYSKQPYYGRKPLKQERLLQCVIIEFSLNVFTDVSDKNIYQIQ